MYFFWVFVTALDLANLPRDRCIAAIPLDRFVTIVPDWIQNYVALDRRVACQKKNSEIKTQRNAQDNKISYFILISYRKKEPVRFCFFLCFYYILIVYHLFTSQHLITARSFIILIRSNVALTTSRFSYR